MSSQSQGGSTTDQQPAARLAAGNGGNGRGAKQSGSSSASNPPKQGSQARAPQKSGAPAPQKANGTEGSGPPKNSWANIARATPPAGAPANGTAQEKPAPAPAAAPATGVTLPAGVTHTPATQAAIKFGSIDPADLQQDAAASAPAPPKPAPINTGGAPTAAPAPAAAAPPAKPVSFAAAISGGAPATAKQQQQQAQHPAGGNAPAPSQQQRGGPHGPRGPRAQPVPAVAIPQGGSYTSQPTMPATFLLSPSGTPVVSGGYGPQAYMVYNPATQTQYFPGSFQGNQYSGFSYGSPAVGGGGPQGPLPTMAVPPPPPQASGTAVPYGNAPSSPLPPKTATQAPPARQRKILRIENPETHEVLNLDAIAASKKPAPEEKAPAPSNAEDKAAAAAKSFKDAAALKPSEPTQAEKPKKPEQPAAEKKSVADEAQVSKEVAKETTPEASEPVQDSKPAETKENQSEVTGEAQVAPLPTAATESEESSATNLSPFGSAEIQQRILPDDGRKRYNNDFLMNIRPLCKDLPPHVEAATLSALAIGEADRNRGPPGPPERDWKTGPRGGVPGGPPGMRGGRGGKRQQGGIEADTWERGKALPPMPGNQFGGRGPPPGMRMSSGPLPALHKTDSAYQIGKVLGDDPEEEKAQKALKSMLNKITPQNFEKITAQIIDKINERKKAKTLSGFIDQIFDKALTETTFSELYARLVASLNPALPELEGDDGNPVQFRRTLLNKCQEEFESGADAMKAVAEREKRQHQEPVEEHQEEEAAPEEAEEGEISEEQIEKRNAAEEAKRQDKAAAEAEVKARKRMLGNIIFVGQLYRFGVLTEGVMHSCIKQLLEETQNPRSEDVECLCKLLTTVGRPMDASQKSLKQTDESGNVSSILTKDLMDVYFKRIDALGRNEALDSRHRFMLIDLIELRRNSWVLRRQAEGPKKIDEIHRDAAIERSRSQALDRQQSRGGRDQRGPSRPAFDTRLDAPIRTINRVGSSDNMGAQSFRPGGRPAPPPRPAPPAAGERPPAPLAKAESPEAEAPKLETEAKQLTDEETEDKVKGLLLEVFNSRDMKEAFLCIKELQEGKANMANVVELFMAVSLESKDTSWEVLRELLKTSSDEKIISQSEFDEGARQLLDKLDDLTVDVPRAPVQVGEVFATLVDIGALDLDAIAQHIVEADQEPAGEGEDTMMVDSGVALKVLGTLLQGLKEAQGAEKVAAAWNATEKDLKSYIAKADRENAEIAEKFVQEYDLADII